MTGSRGFVGSNFCLRLRELNHDYFEIHRGTPEQKLYEILGNVDAVIHLAGVNRPKDSDEYLPGNAGFTEKICSFLAHDNPVPIVFASSTQAELDNPYGRSKLLAEESLKNYSISTGVPVHSIRFPNVFGKWSRPRYNSALATFCDAIANDRPYEVHNCLLYTSPSPRDLSTSRMPSSA